MPTSFELAPFLFVRSLVGSSSMLDWVGVLLAEYLPYVFILAALVVIVRSRPWQRKVWLFIATSLTVILSRGIIASIFHEFLVRPRPFVALGFTPLVAVQDYERLASFPSGHAALLFAIAFVMFYNNRKTGAWFLGFAALNGIARVFVGVHWIGDVVGGLVVALISALLTHALIKKYAPKAIKPEPVPVPSEEESVFQN